MIETDLDQIVEYPVEVMRLICEDSTCVAMLTNKKIEDVTEDDYDEVIGKYVFDYDYVPDTSMQPSAYILIDTEVARVDNRTVKGMELYVTFVCHKEYMKLERKIYPGFIGNRNNNIIRFVNRLLNGKSFVGIGALKLKYMNRVNAPDGFVGKQLCYEIPDFNLPGVSK